MLDNNSIKNLIYLVYINIKNYLQRKKNVITEEDKSLMYNFSQNNLNITIIIF